MDNLVGPGLTDLVQAELRRTGVQPELLMLEVTESRVMQNRVSALDELTRLRLRHVGLSIDDFGTGHSSMAQLRDLPFTEIKIDRSFVHGAAHDSARASICAASLMLARQLGLVVVAEGIEDQADWDHMHSLGAEVAQGYFIAKPFPAVVLPSWIDVWNKRIAKAQEEA
jgi:EAL domain-containing protein (putative c-di-GMP-specific phosphodiesterase class I)